MDRSPPDFRDRPHAGIRPERAPTARRAGSTPTVRRLPRSALVVGTRPLAAKGLLAGLILSASYLLALAVALGRRTVMGQSKTHRIPGLGSRSWHNGTASLVLVALITAVTTILWPWLVDVITYSGTRVPTPLFGGANQWTPSIIDLLSILTVILLVIRGQRKLHDKGESIRQEFGFEIERQELSTGTGSSWDTTRSRPAFSTLLWFPIHALPRRSGVELAKATVSPLEAVMAQYFNYGTRSRASCASSARLFFRRTARRSRGHPGDFVSARRSMQSRWQPFRHAVPDPLDRRRASCCRARSSSLSGATSRPGRPPRCRRNATPSAWNRSAPHCGSISA